MLHCEGGHTLDRFTRSVICVLATLRFYIIDELCSHPTASRNPSITLGMVNIGNETKLDRDSRTLADYGTSAVEELPNVCGNARTYVIHGS